MELDPDTTGRQDNPLGWQPADLGWCVAGLANALAKVTGDLAARHGLIPSEFALLRLFLAKEEWTITELAEELPVKAPRISRVVRKLVDMGLVSRRRPSSDRRVVFLTLTGKGRALTLNIQRTVHHYEAVISEGVSEAEMAVFAAVTARIVDNYAARHSSEGQP